MIIIRKANPNSIFAKLEETIVNFILPIVLVLASLGLLNFYVIPSNRKLPDLKSQLNAKNSENSLLRSKLDQLKILKENEALMIEDSAKISWLLDEKSSAPQLTRQVVLMSNDANTLFRSLDYSNAGSKSRISNVGAVGLDSSSSGLASPSLDDLYREESMNVVLESSSVEDFVRFLNISENSIRLIKVNSINLVSNKGVVRSNINISSPYLNPNFSSYLQTASPIDLKDPSYRSFLGRLDSFRNYAREINSSMSDI